MKHKYFDVFAAFLLAALPVSAQLPVVQADETLKTFGTMGKEVTPLRRDKEAELFHHEGKGCLTHMWFGGGWKGCDKTRIRIYVDGETNASIDMELYLGHGIGFGDEFAPWGVARIGKTGGGANVYDTYRIPFGKSIRVTGQLDPDTTGSPQFWWIIRGTENLPVELGGRAPAGPRAIEALQIGKSHCPAARRIFAVRCQRRRRALSSDDGRERAASLGG